MKKMINFRDGKPEKSGRYLAVIVSDSGNVAGMMDLGYNAESGNWNDSDGSGENAIDDVELWAELPKFERREKDV